MNTEGIKSNWNRIKGHVRERWGRLTEDDLNRIEGRRQVLLGRIQERYGRDLATAEKEVDAWIDDMSRRYAAR